MQQAGEVKDGLFQHWIDSFTLPRDSFSVFSYIFMYKLLWWKNSEFLFRLIFRLYHIEIIIKKTKFAISPLTHENPAVQCAELIYNRDWVDSSQKLSVIIPWSPKSCKMTKPEWNSVSHTSAFYFFFYFFLPWEVWEAFLLTHKQICGRKYNTFTFFYIYIYMCVNAQSNKDHWTQHLYIWSHYLK